LRAYIVKREEGKAEKVEPAAGWYVRKEEKEEM